MEEDRPRTDVPYDFVRYTLFIFLARSDWIRWFVSEADWKKKPRTYKMLMIYVQKTCTFLAFLVAIYKTVLARTIYAAVPGAYNILFYTGWLLSLVAHRTVTRCFFDAEECEISDNNYRRL